MKALQSNQRRLGVKYLFFRCKNFNLALTLLITLLAIDSPEIVSSGIQPRQVTLECCFIRILSYIISSF